MKKRHLYECWICENKVSSMTDEHRFKRSDVTKFYGKGKFEYNNDFAPFLLRKNKIHKLQSSNDRKLTFRKILCQNCNNNLTRPHDLAYEKFIDFYIKHRYEILDKSNPSIDFERVYGDSWQEDSLNLYRYISKRFGCQLVEEGIDVSENIKKFIKENKNQPIDLKFHFTLKIPIINFIQLANQENIYEHLYNGSLIYFPENENREEVSLSYSWFDVGGLNINIVYKRGEFKNRQALDNNIIRIEKIDSKNHYPVKGIYTKSMVDYLENCDTKSGDKFKRDLIDKIDRM